MLWLCRLSFSWWLFILKFNLSNWRSRRQQNALQSAMISVPVECTHTCNSYWNYICHQTHFPVLFRPQKQTKTSIFCFDFFKREIRKCRSWAVHNAFKGFSKSVLLLFNLVFYWQNYICLLEWNCSWSRQVWEQNNLIPFFFPNQHCYDTPGSFNISMISKKYHGTKASLL